MAKINVGKVVMGGLLAGVVMNLIDFITNTYWLDWSAVAQARNLNPAAMQTTEVMVKYILLDFVYGLIAVWVYAAMRSRFGPGAKTAVIAALTVIAASAVPVFSFQIIGMFTMTFYLQGLIAAILSAVPGTLAGAWVYSE